MIVPYQVRSTKKLEGPVRPLKCAQQYATYMYKKHICDSKFKSKMVPITCPTYLFY